MTAALAAFLPTLVSKKIIYGGYLKFGYTEHSYWRSPAFLQVCFSADHGLFSWTPIVILGVAGLFLLRKYDRGLALYLGIVFIVYVYAMGCYENWHGVSSYGNRFFSSLTVVFILGFAALLDRLARLWQEKRTAVFCMERDRRADTVEPRADVPMGHAPDSGARANLLA